MNQFPMTVSTYQGSDDSTKEEERLSDECEIQELFDLIGDPHCRSILDVTTDDSVSAREVSERCEIPLSTTYRKLDSLAEAGFLKEHLRIRESGKHVREYRRLITALLVSVDEDGEIQVRVSRRERASSAFHPISSLAD